MQHQQPLGDVDATLGVDPDQGRPRRHEDSSKAFILDITDLVRTSLTVPLAFAAAAAASTTRPLRSSARCGGEPARPSARSSWSTP
jgi:hypothetical protein